MASKKKVRQKSDRLTAAQEKFAIYYAMHGNGAEAYAHAYPTSRKHTPQYRSEKASKMLADAKIKAKVSGLGSKVTEIAEKKFEITAERVLSELAAIAFANSDDYYEWGVREVPRIDRKTGDLKLDKIGNPIIDKVPFAYVKPSHSLTRQQKAAIVGAEMTMSRTGEPLVSVKMADKRAALRDLGQHLKLFSQGIDIGGKGGGPIQIVVSSAEDAL